MLKPTSSAGTSFAYHLQRMPLGVVVLDARRRVIACNAMAAGLLSAHGIPWQGQDILDLHPPPTRDKVRWLIERAKQAPDEPAGMVLTLPFGTLVARVTLLQDEDSGNSGGGYCMTFHALDAADPATAAPPPAAVAADSGPWLPKLPLSSRSGLALMDVAEVIFLRAEGHYTCAVSARTEALCTLPLAELARRLDPAQFLKVHRSYLVNLSHARAVERHDGQWWLIMGDAGSRVPVSRGNLDSLRHRLAF